MLDYIFDIKKSEKVLNLVSFQTTTLAKKDLYFSQVV